MAIAQEQQDLRSLVRLNANGWLEHTATDEKVLSALQQDTIMWCVSYLWRHGHGAAGAALLTLVPQERAEQILKDF